MRYPQLLIHEDDGRLAGSLRELARTRNWALREPRNWDGCLRLLHQEGPAVFLLRLGRELVNDLDLLGKVADGFPEAAIVVIADAAKADLEALAWDLGATVVLTAGWSPSLLLEILDGLLPATAKPVGG